MNLTTVLGWTSATAGGGIGWWAGAAGGVFTAFVGSVVGTGTGLYLGRRLDGRLLD